MERRDLGRVIYEKEDGGVARLILNWPEKANLQDHDMVWAFDKALGLAEYDYDVKVLIIKSNAKGFCSGHVATGEYPEFDENRSDDDVAVETDGVMLLVDPLSLQYLMGAEVDYSESLQGAQFVIRNPNAKTTCGCGSSFTM